MVLQASVTKWAQDKKMTHNQHRRQPQEANPHTCVTTQAYTGEYSEMQTHAVYTCCLRTPLSATECPTLSVFLLAPFAESKNSLKRFKRRKQQNQSISKKPKHPEVSRFLELPGSLWSASFKVRQCGSKKGISRRWES